jgi:hypothetical protein
VNAADARRLVASDPAVAAWVADTVAAAPPLTGGQLNRVGAIVAAARQAVTTHGRAAA